MFATTCLFESLATEPGLFGGRGAIVRDDDFSRSGAEPLDTSPKQRQNRIAITKDDMKRMIQPLLVEMSCYVAPSSKQDMPEGEGV